MAAQRPSSRASYRGASPVGSFHHSQDDPIVLRNQMSQLKHEIRLKQAQFNAFEVQLSRVPRPLPAEATRLTPSPPPTSFMLPAGRSRKSSLTRQDDSIQEGVPTFSLASPVIKRAESPTRSMSRIPVSSVSQARALAENGSPQTMTPPLEESFSNGLLNGTSNTSITLDPPSPGGSYRRSFGGFSSGNTTKVLADLQAGVVHTKQALENTKGQLRLSQRSVAQLTRQNEDLKDGRERLRLQNESLNNVVARKERLLQEVLERARKAESEATTLRAQVKLESATAKKAVREMETTVQECTAISEKSQREYITLKDTVKGLQDGWKADVESLRAELKEKEETWKKEVEEVSMKYRGLVKLTQAAQAERARMEALKAESRALNAQFEEAFREELRLLATEIQNSGKSTNDAQTTAHILAGELTHIRNLMRLAGADVDGTS